MERFYLLIGIAQYDAAGLSLRSPVNDVLDTLRTLLRLGMNLDNAAIATSPPLTVDHVARFYATSSTHPRLAEQEARAALAKARFFDADANGLFTAAQYIESTMRPCRTTPHLMVSWSGHTTTFADTLLFCTSNFDPNAPDQVDAAVGDRGLDELSDHELERLFTSLQTGGMFPFPVLMETAGIYPEDFDMDAGDRNDHSLFVLINGCRSGIVRHVLTEHAIRGMVLTAGNSELDVREYLLGGSWRGLLSWSVNRVLEQHAYVDDGHADGGMDLSYGSLLRSVQNLCLAVQGVRGQPAMPQMHGLVPRDPEALQRRVWQQLNVAAGGSRLSGSRRGGSMQVWGDIDHITLYAIKITLDGEPERVWSRMMFQRRKDKREHVYRTAAGITRRLRYEVEYWFHVGALPAGAKVTRVRFEVEAVVPVGSSQSSEGNAALDAAIQMGASFEAPLLPPWQSTPVGDLAVPYLRNTSHDYAIAITPTQVRWLRPTTGSSPFQGASVGSSVSFTTPLLRLTQPMQGCIAQIGGDD